MRKDACVFTMHIANIIRRFGKVSTRNIFTFFQRQPDFVLKLSLLLVQSEPQCFYKVVLIKKKSVYALISANG